MTREEAIKIINCYDIGFYDLSGEKIPADKLAEALDMAIEALQWQDRILTQIEDIVLKEHEERREPLPQYEEWQDEFNKMCESARPTTFVADEWHRDTFKGEEE